MERMGREKGCNYAITFCVAKESGEIARVSFLIIMFDVTILIFCFYRKFGSISSHSLTTSTRIMESSSIKIFHVVLKESSFATKNYKMFEF